MSDDNCVCDVNVLNEQVFNQGDAIDKNFVSSTLSIGAFEPSMHFVKETSINFVRL
jgi:hypothetical protein